MTSLCGILFPGGALIYSDLQATSDHRRRSSSKETKIYQAGEERVLLAGTGSVDGIVLAKEKASIEIRKWKMENGLKPIPPSEVGEILRHVMKPEQEANFIMAGYNMLTHQAEIAEVSENGFDWKTGLVQVSGSGTSYMHSQALKLENKVLSTINTTIVTTEQMYDFLPTLKFPKEAAMLEGLDVIHCGPESDIFSGGRGYQLMIVTGRGVEGYIIPKDEARRLLEKKWKAEFSMVNPEIKSAPLRYSQAFRQWRVMLR